MLNIRYCDSNFMQEPLFLRVLIYNQWWYTHDDWYDINLITASDILLLFFTIVLKVYLPYFWVLLASPVGTAVAAEIIRNMRAILALAPIFTKSPIVLI